MLDSVGNRRDSLSHLRSQIKVKANWFLMKTQLLKYIKLEKLQALEYRDENVYGELQPKSKVKKRFTYREAKAQHREKRRERSDQN